MVDIDIEQFKKTYCDKKKTTISPIPNYKFCHNDPTVV